MDAFITFIMQTLFVFEKISDTCYTKILMAKVALFLTSDIQKKTVVSSKIFKMRMLYFPLKFPIKR